MREEGHLPAVAGGKPIRDPDRFLVFGAPVLGEPEIAAVVDCLRRRWPGTGPKVHEFELAFARYKRAPRAVAVNSCTSALHLSLLALGIGPGDEVITTSMTFCSTINAVLHTGATCVLADCDRHSFNVTPDAIADRITERTRAVLVVHMCGRCCEMDAIMKLAHSRGLAVIEDCAHAIEAEYHATPAGTIGDVGCFSFYATKNLTTVEGGMALAKDPSVAAEIRTLASHGMSADAWKRFSDDGYRHYLAIRPGFKCNMPDIHAAIGLAQLDRLEAHAARREEIWAMYDEAMRSLPLDSPPAPEPGTRHARHLYTPLLALERITLTRDQVLQALWAENIGAGVHFIPVHQHPYGRTLWPQSRFPNAEYIGQRTISLPLAGDLSDEDVEDVCRALRRILNHYS